MTDLERMTAERDALRKQVETKNLIISLLRSQIRMLGHIPTVIENKEIADAETDFRIAERRAKALRPGH